MKSCVIYSTKTNFSYFLNFRYCADLAQNLPEPAPNKVLRVLQISSKLVHFRRSYSLTREHRQIAPYSESIFGGRLASSRIKMSGSFSTHSVYAYTKCVDFMLLIKQTTNYTRDLLHRQQWSSVGVEYKQKLSHSQYQMKQYQGRRLHHLSHLLILWNFKETDTTRSIFSIGAKATLRGKVERLSIDRMMSKKVMRVKGNKESCIKCNGVRLAVTTAGAHNNEKWTSGFGQVLAYSFRYSAYSQIKSYFFGAALNIAASRTAVQSRLALFCHLPTEIHSNQLQLSTQIQSTLCSVHQKKFEQPKYLRINVSLYCNFPDNFYHRRSGPGMGRQPLIGAVV